MIPSDPLANFLLPIPATLGSVSIVILLLKGGMLSLEDQILVPLSWKLRLPPSHFELLTLMNQQAKQVQCAYCGDWFWLSRGSWVTIAQWGKEEYVWIVGNLPKCSCYSHVLRFNSRKKLQQPSSGRTANDPDSSQMKGWVILPGKDDGYVRRLLRAKGLWN